MSFQEQKNDYRFKLTIIPGVKKQPHEINGVTSLCPKNYSELTSKDLRNQIAAAKSYKSKNITIEVQYTTKYAKAISQETKTMIFRYLSDEQGGNVNKPTPNFELDKKKMGLS